MNCDIKEFENNEDVKYWCVKHRALAINSSECLSEVKDLYQNIIEMNKEDIKSIKIEYQDISKKLIPEVYINDVLCQGILRIGNSLIEPKDFGGLMLSTLNHIKLEDSICPYCHHSHSDDGMFAVMPHDKHLCQYCGRFFPVPKANIGNEIALYFDIPSINIKDNVTQVKENTSIKYDVLKGELLINNDSVNRVIYNDKEILLKDYLYDILKDKY